MKPGEFQRCYHSIERVQWVNVQPCVACGVVGHSDNAHVGRKGAGARRKADYDQIVPLCGRRLNGAGIVNIGCHGLFDVYRSLFLAANPKLDLAALMRKTEADWQAFERAQPEIAW